MRRRLAVAVAAATLPGLAAVAGIAATGTPGGDPAPAAFRLADGSAGCNFLGSGEIACRAAGETAAVVLEPGGRSRVDEEVVVSWDAATPVLLPAESWWNGAFSCRVRSERIVCSARG